MRKTIYVTGLILLLCLAFTPIAGAQGVLDANLYSLAPEALPAVNMEPLALPDAAVTAAAPASWVPRLPLIRSTLHFRLFYRDQQNPEGTGRARTDSLSSFDVPNARLYFVGEAFRGLSYQLAFRVSGDNANEFLKDAYFDWTPNAQFAWVPSTFGIQMGKFPDTANPARASSHTNRLQGAEAPFSLGPPVLSSVRIYALRPYMSFWDDRIQTMYLLTPAGAVSGQLQNQSNDWRHTVGFAIAPLGRFPIGLATENDLRHRPLGINLGYGYTRSYEKYFRCLTSSSTNACLTSQTAGHDGPSNYHAADAVAVWQGLFLWYKFVLKDSVDHSGAGVRFNAGGVAHRATISYAIKTPWGDLVPWYQWNQINLADRTVLRGQATAATAGGNVSGALIDVGGAATELIGGTTRTAQIRDHAIGLNLHISGESLAIKPYVRIDTIRHNTWFVVQLQHQFFFNPEGKYR
jgi:hypothetical protein